ncbi:type II secretion system minor pseudopilin GspI [Hyphomonas sp.]|uniref:type II secretion system minor pseudopilin GspI n=1 Tax=Hyphomonas sp. TaxID=87 RepID=UPI00391D02A7
MRQEAGFTLLEALVALAVFSTAAVGLISLNTNSVRISRDLGDRVLARQVAENIAVDTLTDPAKQRPGTSSGEETQRQQTYVWERIVVPAGRDGLIQVDIRVRPAGSDRVAGHVSFLHVAEGAP